MDGFDACDNASSLGLAVLACAVLRCWRGMNAARVGMDGARAAALVLGHGDEVCVVDPLRTRANSFTLARSMMDVVDAGYVFHVAEKAVVQVLADRAHQARSRHKWVTAVVEAVDLDSDSFTVRTLEKPHAVQVLHRQSYHWRRLARGDDCDVDDVVRELLRRKQSARRQSGTDGAQDSAQGSAQGKKRPHAECTSTP